VAPTSEPNLRGGPGTLSDELVAGLRAALGVQNVDGGADGQAKEDVGAGAKGAAAVAGSPADAGAGGAGAGVAGKPATLAEAAERLGVDVAALYELAVPMGGEGEAVTLGALKDRATKAHGLEVERLAFERERDAGRSEIAQARAELHDLLALLPPSALDARTLGALRERQERARSEQMALLLKAEPSWRDERVYQRDYAAIRETVAAFGFSDAELASIVDHRLLRMLASFARTRAASAAVLDALKSRERRQGSERPAREAARPNAGGVPGRGAESKGRAAQVSAIANLLTKE
jgi:hypothetical protein